MSLWNSDSVADCAFLYTQRCLVMHAAKETRTNYHYILYPWSLCPMCLFSVHFSSSLTILPSPCMSRDEALLIVEVCDCNKLWQLTMQACTELGGESHAANPWGRRSRQQSPNHPSCMDAQPPRSLTIIQNAYSDITQTWAMSRWLLHSTDITSPTFNVVYILHWFVGYSKIEALEYELQSCISKYFCMPCVYWCF